MAKASVDRIRADFDRIARLVGRRPEAPDPYDAFLLSRLPARCEKLLEIGCGAGRLARAASGRATSVLALDVSPEMIRLAQSRAAGNPRIRFLCADFMTASLEEASFDCVLSVATLHHLDTVAAVRRMKALVRPGGVLLLHDLRAPTGAVDWVVSGLAALVSGDAFRWLRARHRTRGELRHAWHEHGALDQYLDLHAVRDLCREQLPGARLLRHPLWRYTIVWERPSP